MALTSFGTPYDAPKFYDVFLLVRHRNRFFDASNSDRDPDFDADKLWLGAIFGMSAMVGLWVRI
jgi:hypothetical protein